MKASGFDGFLAGTLFISARPLARVASAGGAALSEKRLWWSVVP